MTAVLDTVAPYEKIEKVYWKMKTAIEEGFQEWNAEFHAHFSHWYNWGTSFYPTFLIKQFPEDKREALKLYNKVLETAVRASIENGGVVNEHHGIGMRLGRFLKEAYGEGYEFAQLIKKSLDPNNIMNPGKLGLGE
jgi:alkyldihydroxyacetonephosphate synthase